MIYPSADDNQDKTLRDFHGDRLSQGQRVGLINLGCARNLVDSQEILGRLKKNGHRIVDIGQADVAVVNTCSFIEEARQESIDTILELIKLKEQGKLKKVIVAGCLAQRYGAQLAEELKEVDAIVGTPTLDRNKILSQLNLTPSHFAYVKICESCYNQCSFCAIPKIKGKFISRTMESVIEEVKKLDAQGVREINIIGQDITAYGMDVYREKRLAKLLKEITQVVENIKWIRLLYAFPAHMTDELIDAIAAEERICSYIDIPLQHVSDHLLLSMNRNITTAGTHALIEKMRKRVKNVSLRTTFIVGLPGETDDDFNELMDFVREYRFEKAGAFIYSKEEGTAAGDMPGQVSKSIKKNRLDRLMKEQQVISKDVQQQSIGRRLTVLVDEKAAGEDGVYLARSEYDAPDVDGLVYVHSDKELKIGDFVDVEITDALEYDLVGQAL